MAEMNIIMPAPITPITKVQRENASQQGHGGGRAAAKVPRKAEQLREAGRIHEITGMGWGMMGTVVSGVGLG
jgi:hypothetical protein